MAYYKLTDTQALNVKKWLASIAITADLKGRTEFDNELKPILKALDEPVDIKNG